jgi:hypothetical protein
MKCLLVLVLLIFIPALLFCQNAKEPNLPPHKADSVKYDTIHIKNVRLMHTPDSIIPVQMDSAMLEKSYSLTPKEIKMRENTKTFYDSAYVKFGRHKMSRFLYTWLFVPPGIITLPDTVQLIRGEALYVKYQGKIIRNITIKTIDPFGPTVADTAARPMTWIGKTGNRTHITTRKYVIRKNLLFKTGQKVDPIQLADNERILREMPAIDDASIIISPTDPAGDSVDITVVTKDVFSIGFDFVSVSTDKSVFRIYDANFLGQGDRLLNEFSIRSHRAPFFREEGVGYYLTNIGGKFIDVTTNYFHDDDGNQNVGIQIQRGFYSNRTKWAGDGLFRYLKNVDIVSDTFKLISYLYDAHLWIGRAFFLKTKVENLRFILSEVAYSRHYFSRPFFSPDSNKRYYNYLQLFTGFSISQNNYYFSSYVFRMGKREIIPYGERFQLTIGPEISDFYTRLYGGAEIAYGNFIKKFGFFSGRVTFSGYFLGSSFEDAIVKVQARYMTFLYYTPSKRYKFRTFVITDYRTGFNFKSNNLDVANIDQYLQLNKTTDEKSLQGTGALAATLSLMVYTPWYLYGFRFALLEQIQGGFVARQNRALFATRYYPGIRTGLVLVNDNLIFPALVLSVFYYPSSPSGGPWLQFLMNTDTGTQFPDYNVSAPREETLQN